MKRSVWDRYLPSDTQGLVVLAIGVGLLLLALA